MRILKKILRNIAEVPIYVISLISKRDKNIWVFGAWKGNFFADNTKYLYEYVCNNHKDIKAIWVTKNKNIIKEMNIKGYECYYFYSLKGIYYSLRSEVVFQTEGNQDVNSFCLGRAKVIQLWHGTPLKKIGYDNDNRNKENFLKKIIFKILPYKEPNKSGNLYCVSSELVANKFMSAFRTRKENIFITGQPRIDGLFKRGKNNFINNVKAQIGNASLIIYMPTHRKFGNGKNIYTKDVLDNINLKLKEQNIYMIFKPHFHEIKNILNNNYTFTNIIIPRAESELSDPYSFIQECDLLITDYSSIFFDFMILDKPIVFFPYDLKEYVESDFPLYFDYTSTVPGPISYTWDELIENIINELKYDTYKDKRNNELRRFNKFNDNKNSYRVYKKVLQILGKERI